MIRRLARRIRRARRDAADRALQQSVTQAKASRTGTYDPAPRTTAVIQCFNKARTLPALLDRLTEPGLFGEIVAIDDGSVDGTGAVLAERLTGPNHFVLRANDLFEIRTYSRALRMAAGEFVALLQDDDLPPEGDAWVTDALAAFEAEPRLAILGGRDGLDLRMPDPDDGVGTWTRSADGVAGAPGINKYRSFGRGQEPVPTPPGFKPAMVVNRAPMWVRRSALETLGLPDDAFAPYQCDDVDWCLRAWKRGLGVGLYPARFTPVVEGGMRAFNSGEVSAQARRNWKLIYDRHGAEIASGELAERVRNFRDDAPADDAPADDAPADDAPADDGRAGGS